MKDLSNSADIEIVVAEFYKKAINDEIIGVYFTKIAALDLKSHIPKIVSFWEVMLLGTGDYRGNPMREHFPLNRKLPMEQKHFKQWLKLWTETIDTHFEGPHAAEAKTRGAHIANLMSFKMEEATKRGGF